MCTCLCKCAKCFTLWKKKKYADNQSMKTVQCRNVDENTYLLRLEMALETAPETLLEVCYSRWNCSPYI